MALRLEYSEQTNLYMLKELKTRPIIAPQPVLIVGTYDADRVADAMNVAWGGQCWDKYVALNISSNHKTTENIRNNKAFTLHIADVDRMELADYFGLVSGHKEHKMEHVHAHTVKGKMVNAPLIEEFTLAMECLVVSMDDNGDGGTRVVAEVVRTVADDSILDENDKVDFSRLRPITYDSEQHLYRKVGQAVGRAFHDGAALK